MISSHPMYARVQLTSLSYPTPESPNPLTMLYRKLLVSWLSSTNSLLKGSSFFIIGGN